MKINSIVLHGPHFSSNCYILEKDDKAVVIDPGFEVSNLYSYLKNKDLKVEKILLTHGHFDHWGGLKKLKEIYPEAITYASSLDKTWFEIGPNNPYDYKPIFDNDLSKISQVNLLGNDFKVISTPGHSLGSVSFYFDKYLFSGDVLFNGSIGRTDLPEGNQNTLFKSIQTLYKLPENTIVYSGHGRTTTIINEKNTNPFIRG